MDASGIDCGTCWQFDPTHFAPRCNVLLGVAQELNAFLTHLATLGQVSAYTQNQALAASLFLCRKVLGGARSPRWCGEALA
ncbi:hypothetical protein KBZ18_11345 [Synechococcus sp. Cruz-9H2]|uniref:phage integrase N-terminal SAM-like domain-containing protein n=1 Tax=unclassified Synechococcus TaxID=2626047 RepID=UPI0020CB7594|nr:MULTISPECIES: hypothetical protein [unclassified Synechococcus]MCP9820082.1 hypothetical protein [Synechococcus sp. Cruz-9H2]MCP9844388.1 hypothetical protein [Synechococcus sp. Edmonson 11F2]MCP9856512.1 hypothetical protein [Synechococcus sp. Cruz-9C9]MCP9863713.1 hypothetical protein [Synechococcus sp. Cruz-7E5]MCP9870992.1 hypothetical protein [Synechococcus sp. Cruz-7B9]